MRTVVVIASFAFAALSFGQSADTLALESPILFSPADEFAPPALVPNLPLTLSFSPPAPFEPWRFSPKEEVLAGRFSLALRSPAEFRGRESDEMIALKSALGMAQASATLYLAYLHVKKYGLR
jgi:hypothetical protein